MKRRLGWFLVSVRRNHCKKRLRLEQMISLETWAVLLVPMPTVLLLCILSYLLSRTRR